jgi:hypothetical protein
LGGFTVEDDNERTTKALIRQIVEKPKNMVQLINEMFSNLSNLDSDRRRKAIEELIGAALDLQQTDYDKFENFILESLAKQSDQVRRTVLESSMMITDSLNADKMEKARLGMQHCAKDLITKSGKADDVIITVYESLAFMRSDTAIDFIRSILDSTLEMPSFLYHDFMKRRMTLMVNLPDSMMQRILKYWVIAVGELPFQKSQKEKGMRAKILSEMPPEKQRKFSRIMESLGISVE